MNTDMFDNTIKDKLYNHEVEAPDVLSAVFEKRNAWHIFRNRLFIQRYKIMVAAAVILLFMAATFSALHFGVSKQALPLVDQIDGNTDGMNDQSTIEKTANQPNDERQNDVVDASNKTIPTTKANKPTNAIQKNTKIKSNHIGGVSDKPVLTNNPFKNKAEPEELKKVTNDVNGTDDIKTYADNTTVKTEIKSDPTNEANGKDEKEIKTEEISKNEIHDVNPAGTLPQVDVEGGKDGILPSKPGIKKLSVIASFGPALANRNLDNSLNGPIAELRNQTEQPKLSSQAMVLVNRELTPVLEVYGGLSVLMRKEQLSYTKTTNHTDTKINSHQVVEYHPVLPPKTVTVYDTSYSHITLNQNISKNNSYTYFTIPMGLRFSGYRKNLGVHASADIALQIASINKGSILTSEAIELSTSSSSFKRSQIGASLGFGFGFSYLFDPRLSLIVDPKFTYFITPTNNRNYNINQHDYSGGLLIGLKYHF